MTNYEEGKAMGQKTLCDWSKDDRKKAWAEYIELVKKPRFVCDSCGRAANKKKNLCHPHKLPKE
jgi:hypothetical protein